MEENQPNSDQKMRLKFSIFQIDNFDLYQIPMQCKAKSQFSISIAFILKWKMQLVSMHQIWFWFTYSYKCTLWQLVKYLPILQKFRIFLSGTKIQSLPFAFTADRLGRNTSNLLNFTGKFMTDLGAKIQLYFLLYF